MKKISLLFAMALLLSAAHAASASYSDVCGVAAFNADGNNSLLFIGVAFALVSSAIGLAYMYSKVREDPALSTWAKDEAYNLVISAFLFAGILAFFSGSCAIAESYANGSPFGASARYLDSLLNANGQNVLRDLTSSSLNDQLDATYYRYYGFTPFTGGGVAGRADRKAHSAQKEFLIDLYVPITASLTAQKYILDALQWIGASVLLPFAFVMRLVPPTREFGNMLIAVFFGIYIVVPTMYAMSGGIFANILSSKTQCEITDYCGINNFYSYGLDPSQSSDAKETILYKIGSTLPQAIFLPNLVIVVTVTCIMSMSKALRAMAA